MKVHIISMEASKEGIWFQFFYRGEDGSERKFWKPSKHVKWPEGGYPRSVLGRTGEIIDDEIILDEVPVRSSLALEDGR